jgi:hypothetical protein
VAKSNSPDRLAPEAHITDGVQQVSYRVAFGLEMQEPEWSGWESRIRCGIQYVSYGVVFGFQAPELQWPGAIHPIDCPPEASIISGGQPFGRSVVRSVVRSIT